MNKFKVFFESLQEKGSFKGLVFEELDNEQSQELHALYLDSLDTELKKAQESAKKSTEANAELKGKIGDLLSTIQDFEKRYSELNYKLATGLTEQIIGSSKSGIDPKYQKSVDIAKRFLKDMNEAVKNGDKAEFKIHVKHALGAIASKGDTLTTSVANFTRGVEDPTVTRLAHRRLTAYEAIPSKPTIGPNQGGTYRYLEQDSASSVRAAAQIAEGAASPESTIAWVKRSIDLKKTSDHLPYSDEFEYDFADLMNELVFFLRQSVDIQVDDQIINGDGTNENYSGILDSIPAYVPVASGIVDANIFDLMCKVLEDITSTEGSKYKPDLVLMNSSDIVSINYLLKKDDNNNYMNLQMMAEQKGFIVVENNSLTANNMIVGDRRYAKIPEDGMIRVKTGLYAGDDAIEGITRVLVETRKNLLIKTEEQTGWRQVTDIAAALTVLAS